MLPPGEYSMQAECREGRPGRIQRATLVSGSRERVVMHARLGQVLETRPTLSLIYDDARSLEAGLQEDVAIIGRTVGADRVLVVSDKGRGPLQTLAYAVTDVAIDFTGSAQMDRPVDDAAATVSSERRLRSTRPTTAIHSYFQGSFSSVPESQHLPSVGASSSAWRIAGRTSINYQHPNSGPSAMCRLRKTSVARPPCCLPVGLARRYSPPRFRCGFLTKMELHGGPGSPPPSVRALARGTSTSWFTNQNSLDRETRSRHRLRHEGHFSSGSQCHY